MQQSQTKSKKKTKKDGPPLSKVLERIAPKDHDAGNWPASEEEYQNIFEAASDGLYIYDIKLERVVEANPAACQMHGYSREEFIGLNPTVFIVSESQALFREHARAQAGKIFESLAVHLRKDGAPFHVEVRRSVLTYHGRLCLLSVVRDVSQRIQTEKILSGQVRELATLLTISHTLASTLELQPGLILDQLREIIEYDRAGLFSLEGSGMITLAMRGTPQLEQSEPIYIPLSTPEMPVTLFNEHHPIRIGDVWGDHSQALFLRSLLKEGAVVLLEGMHSWMWVPLAVKSRIIGGMGVAHQTAHYFTAHHADLALSVANQAAITMINAELYGNAQTLAVLEERQRLARNLHDAVNQSLFSAGLIAEVLPRLWDRDQAMARQSLEDLRRLTRGAQAEMRALLAELRPSTLTDSDLVELLQLLGNAFTGRTNIPARINVVGKGVLPSRVQVAIYRICQETLNNVAKHARARMVDVLLKHEDSVIEVVIRDDGHGFDPEQTPTGHYGLSMMRERAEAVGAQLVINSQPGQGTEVKIRWIDDSSKED
jgi:PAS domain S-box-containing protein